MIRLRWGMHLHKYALCVLDFDLVLSLLSSLLYSLELSELLSFYASPFKLFLINLFLTISSSEESELSDEDCFPAAFSFFSFF